MTVAIPLSSSERWDREARRLKRKRGSWLMLNDLPKAYTEGRAGRHEKIREAFERRGLDVDVKSRKVEGLTMWWVRTL